MENFMNEIILKSGTYRRTTEDTWLFSIPEDKVFHIYSKEEMIKLTEDEVSYIKSLISKAEIKISSLYDVRDRLIEEGSNGTF